MRRGGRCAPMPVRSQGRDRYPRKESLMPSPFPGMDPFLETNPIFQELHTQMLAEMQALLQPQLRPKYVARLERHLSEGSVWDAPQGAISLERKEPDVTIVSQSDG